MSGTVVDVRRVDKAGEVWYDDLSRAGGSGTSEK